jgi:hypothetical protein
MARIKNFKATTYSGIAGPLILIEGQVNCGFLEVEPTIEKREPQGFNPAVLQVVAYPALDQASASFREGCASYHLKTEVQYKEVEIFNSQGECLDRVKVSHQ